MDIGKKWFSECFFKVDLFEGEELVKDEKDFGRLENDDLSFRSSDDDDGEVYDDLFLI